MTGKTPDAVREDSWGQVMHNAAKKKDSEKDTAGNDQIPLNRSEVY
jgi:hypothetical protein